MCVHVTCSQARCVRVRACLFQLTMEIRCMVSWASHPTALHCRAFSLNSRAWRRYYRTNAAHTLFTKITPRMNASLCATPCVHCGALTRTHQSPCTCNPDARAVAKWQIRAKSVRTRLPLCAHCPNASRCTTWPFVRAPCPGGVVREPVVWTRRCRTSLARTSHSHTCVARYCLACAPAAH